MEVILLFFIGKRLNELLVKMGEEESDRGLILGVTAFILKELKIITKINITMYIAYL